MKTFNKFLLALCLFSLTSVMCSAERLLNGLSDLKDVKSIYVSNTTLQILGKLGLGSIEGLGNYSSFMNDLKSVEVISADGKSTVKKHTKKINKYVKKIANTNVLVSQTIDNNKKNTLKIMEHFNSASGDTDGLIIYVKKETSILLLHLEGSINPQALMGL